MEFSGRMGTDAQFGPDAGVAAREVSTDEHLLRHPIPVTGAIGRCSVCARLTVLPFHPPGRNADP